MNWLIVAAFAGITLPFFTLWVIFNGLVRHRNTVRQSLSGISVQLKRRADLIPNLVEVVRGYAQHEREVLQQVTQLRDLAKSSAALLTNLSTAPALEHVGKSVDTVFVRLLAIAEAYPDLKASANFLELQKQLEETENQITAARRIYNSNVAGYNTATEQFPSNLVAKWSGFLPQSFFQEDAAANTVPKVAMTAA